MFALVFEAGDSLMGELQAFVEENGIRASHFRGIGALEQVTLAYFDMQTKAYVERQIEEQVEVVSLLGTVSRHEKEHKVHAHIAVGREDYSALAGHLVDGRVNPTLEVFLTETPSDLGRTFNAELGMPLLDPEA